MLSCNEKLRRLIVPAPAFTGTQCKPEKRVTRVKDSTPGLYRCTRDQACHTDWSTSAGWRPGNVRNFIAIPHWNKTSVKTTESLPLKQDLKDDATMTSMDRNRLTWWKNRPNSIRINSQRHLSAQIDFKHLTIQRQHRTGIGRNHRHHRSHHWHKTS